ncbi:hypothetical protein JTE90_012641 [Oedothorax gibbosus]|uniref:DDE Tnp4 domain-containing protein n=1 Tax=Oedothorax gibbosus TaxID=931172 RepID=A0AAV6UJH0_9ARAC|nr:hypothetical protein JTE90_012641 [Oedothorax gibbosus]
MQITSSPISMWAPVGDFQTQESSAPLGCSLSNGTQAIPEDRELCPGGTAMPHVFVADEAFPLQRHIMRPFPRSQLDSRTRIYNYRLSRARRIVKNAFGILSARWRVYKRPFECKLQTVDKIVLATCALHNFLGQTGGHGNISSEKITTSLEENENQLLDLPRIGNNPYREAFIVRDMFCNYFENMTWQNQVNSVKKNCKYLYLLYKK